MTNRLTIPRASPGEETRQLAAAIADVHHALGTVVEHAEWLVPGEAVDEVRSAWASAERSFGDLVQALLKAGEPSPAPGALPPVAISLEALDNNELTGQQGAVKLSLLGRLRDGFFRVWNSLPRTTEKQQKASEAGADYLEYAATIVGSIPGYDEVEEFLLMVKQLLSIRAKRGDRVDA